MTIRTFKVADDTGEDRILSWYLINDPNNKKQAELIKHAEGLYGSLFEAEYLEPYENFRKYARDSYAARKNLKVGKECKMVDSWYLGVEKGEVIAFLFFTLYPKDCLGVISYAGSKEPFYTKSIERLINEEQKDLFPSLTPEAYLFELEKIYPSEYKYLKPRYRDDPVYGNIRRRKLITYQYQKLGALKIPWVHYRQPILAKGKKFQEIDMHLMYWPSSEHRSIKLESFDRERVKKLLEFMYLTFYLDAFKATEDENKMPYWETVLKEMYLEAVRDLPSSVNFERIYEKSFYKSSPGSVFISYANNDVALAELIARRLEDRCIDVFFWEQDHWENIGKDLRIIGEKFEKADAVIYIITRNTLYAEGQREEINYLKKKRKDKIYVISYVPQEELEYLGFKVRGKDALIYNSVGTSDELTKSVDNIIKSFLE